GRYLTKGIPCGAAARARARSNSAYLGTFAASLASSDPAYAPGAGARSVRSEQNVSGTARTSAPASSTDTRILPTGYRRAPDIPQVARARAVTITSTAADAMPPSKRGK